MRQSTQPPATGSTTSTAIRPDTSSSPTISKSSRPRSTLAGRTIGAVAEPGGAAGRAAVLGRPITHSLSPVLHNAAYRALGLAWEYTAIDCGTDELAAVLDQRADWQGFSL